MNSRLAVFFFSMLLGACGSGASTPDDDPTPPAHVAARCAPLNHGCVGADPDAPRACYQRPGDVFGYQIDCEPGTELRGQWTVNGFEPCRCENGAY